MVEPISITAVITALGGFVISAVNRITENPIMAYFLILAVLIADGGLSLVVGGQGFFGGMLSFIISQWGIPIQIFSWQLMILFGSFPLIRFVVHASG